MFGFGDLGDRGSDSHIEDLGHPDFVLGDPTHFSRMGHVPYHINNHRI